MFKPQKDERLSWPRWLTCSGQFIHVKGETQADWHICR